MSSPPLPIERQRQGLKGSSRVGGESTSIEVDGPTKPLANGLLVETPDGFGFIIHADLARPQGDFLVYGSHSPHGDHDLSRPGTVEPAHGG